MVLAFALGYVTCYKIMAPSSTAMVTSTKAIFKNYAAQANNEPEKLTPSFKNYGEQANSEPAKLASGPQNTSILTMCHRQMKSRDEIPAMLNEAGLLGEGVEIGVNEGDFSEHVLGHWKGKKYHLVDPWMHQTMQVYDDVNNKPQEVQDEKLRKVISRLQGHEGRYMIHRQFSLEASKEFKDESLDFIYVDARHDYEGVKEDMIAWWPKLKIGGLLAGHDFVPDGNHKEGAFGVQKAVAELAQRWQREVQSISSKNLDTGRQEPQHWDGGWTTWYFFK